MTSQSKDAIGSRTMTIERKKELIDAVNKTNKLIDEDIKRINDVVHKEDEIKHDHDEAGSIELTELLDDVM